MRVLETPRLLLVPVEEKDLLNLLDLQWDREVVKYMKFTPLSLENQKEWLKNLGKNSLAFTMFQKIGDNKEFIGLATLNNIDHVNQRASWGMKLKTNIQSKGLGFEASLLIIHYAFNFLNMNKIHADYIEENISSKKLTEKIGLRKEGLLVNHLYQNGEFRNLILVGILKEEFYSHNNEMLLHYQIIA